MATTEQAMPTKEVAERSMPQKKTLRKDRHHNEPKKKVQH